MSDGKVLHLFDLRLDEDGNPVLVDGTEYIRRKIAKRLDPTPPVVLPFPEKRREEG